MIRPNGDKDITHSVKPDYYDEQTIEDAEKNIATILNYTIDLMEKTKHDIKHIIKKII